MHFIDLLPRELSAKLPMNIFRALVALLVLFSSARAQVPGVGLPLIGSAKQANTVSLTANTNLTRDLSTDHFVATPSIGAENANRTIAVVLFVSYAGCVPSVLSAQINGNTLNLAVTSDENSTYIYYKRVPTGATASLDFNINNHGCIFGLAVSVYRVVAPTEAPFATMAHEQNGTSVAGNLNVALNGVAIAAAFPHDSGSTVTWGVMTRDVMSTNPTRSSAKYGPAPSAQTPLVFSVNQTVNTTVEIVGASWQ
jgi:hypothetical protein